VVWPSYRGLQPSTDGASKSKRAQAKGATSCEEILVQRLLESDFELERTPDGVFGRPDVVIRSAHAAIICDGDFWHGRRWGDRRRRLSRGANASYWIAKIEGNRRRARAVNQCLSESGWLVVRLWESDIRTGTAPSSALLNRLRKRLENRDVRGS
jgi:DNA mismatch endonuclease (patch repair protein)